MTALVPLKEVAEVLGIHPNTAYRQAKEHEEIAPGLPCFRIRGRWYCHRPQLDRFIAGETRAAS